MAILTLTARASSYAFEKHEEHILREALLDADRGTVITPIGSVQDVILNADTGQTLNGYNYSETALAQMCSMLVPGLLQLLMDVCGQWRKPGDDLRYYSSQQGVDIFNRLVRLRFERKLAGTQFIRDTRNKSIDGVVGARYRYLANSDFAERVSQLYANSDIKFHSAYLYGRQLALRYAFKEADKYLYNIDEDLFVPGYHFANTEVGGQSVRTASLLIHCATGNCALGPYREGSGGRVVHSGRGFEKRLHSLLSTMSHRLPTQSDLEYGVRLLKSKPLNLGGEANDRNTRHLITVLRRRKLNLSFAKRVVSSAAAKGCSDTDILIDRMPEERKLVLSSRTGYDLCIATIREAKQLPLDQREIAEQVAYSLLTGKIPL